MVAFETGTSPADLSDIDEKDVGEIERAPVAFDKFPRIDTIRFDNSENEQAARNATTGIGLPRTRTLERPRYSQSNKVIGDFRTLSIQVARADTANVDTTKEKKRTLTGM